MEFMEFMEFVDMVEKMQKMQKEYFKFRDGRVLSECKRLEKQVAESIDRIKHGDKKSGQRELF